METNFRSIRWATLLAVKGFLKGGKLLKTHIGENVKVQATAQGMNFITLAREVGISISQLYRKVRGEKLFEDEELCDIAKALNTTVEVLMKPRGGYFTAGDILLSGDEIAQLLGVSRNSYTRMVREGRAPGMKVGKGYVCSHEALTRFMVRGGAANKTADIWDEAQTPEAMA
jgi:excisionase family DNA binding protein